MELAEINRYDNNIMRFISKILEKFMAKYETLGLIID
jgi:hypothetical protein